MKRYDHTFVIQNSKKIDADGTPSNVRRLSTTVYPSFLKSGHGTRIVSQDGDRLDLLAKEFYGDESLWFVIARANNLGRGSLSIPPGIVISIPYETVNGIGSLLYDYNLRR